MQRRILLPENWVEWMSLLVLVWYFGLLVWGPEALEFIHPYFISQLLYPAKSEGLGAIVDILAGLGILLVIINLSLVVLHWLVFKKISFKAPVWSGIAVTVIWFVTSYL